MKRQWAFWKKITAGFVLVTSLTILVAGLAIFQLNATVHEKDHIINISARTFAQGRALAAAFEQKVAEGQSFLLEPSQRHVDRMVEARREMVQLLAELERDVQDDEGRRLLERFRGLEAEHQSRMDRAHELRRKEGTQTTFASAREFESSVAPVRAQIVDMVRQFQALQNRLIDTQVRKANEAAERARLLLVSIGLLAVALASVAATVLARSLARELGTAVQHLQSSSTQLQSACTEQASAMAEQRSTTTETSTTMKELAATSRQMMEGAQRVTRIAEETALASRQGNNTVRKAEDAINAVKREVELIVGHMLDLGKKSQHVGGVLELINELAEQTNILAINATIESAGAGEAGKRFAAVADEIRKLADRVAGSTKEIRTLVDEIRTAASKTVMVTEDGAKAVEIGTREFGEVANAFRQIAERVSTTTDASREIELGSKQQVTAVEQVNTAMQGIVAAAAQTESTTRQTLETAGQLTKLATNLSTLVQGRT